MREWPGGGLAQSLRSGDCARPLPGHWRLICALASFPPTVRSCSLHAPPIMRADPSPPEQLLWAALTNRKLGVSFRRQVPLAGYICDFVCANRRLVVEVDGAHHARRSGADRRRDECLQRLGYRVLRLEARLVLKDLACAVAGVAAALEG
jgi:very-short-patch-repair endonuclease